MGQLFNLFVCVWYVPGLAFGSFSSFLAEGGLELGETVRKHFE